MFEKKLIMFMPFIGGGGVEKNLYAISNHLADKVDVTICTLSKEKKNKFNRNIKFLSPKYKINKNINIRLKYVFCLLTLFKFLIQNKNSLVFAFQANIYCILICKLLGISIIVRSNSSPTGWYHNILKKTLYKIIISKADIVIVNSLKFKKQMENKFKIKVKCIYNPLNKKEIFYKSKKGIKDKFFKGKKYLKILNIGRLTEQKDQITILKALKVLRKKNIKFKALILGSGVEESNLKNYIQNNNLKNFIKIKNFIENPFGIMSQADLFILSSKYEGLPNVLLEASSLKKFIISTDCPTGPKEILCNGKGGYFFEIGNYNQLYNKILSYIRNKKKISEKIDYSYNQLERFNSKKNLNEYYKLIKKFLVLN
tara:strand:+ start:6657 stop:7766 length:1110 start_codon:yes stop_codon:yes gene_type:complete